MGDSVGCGCAHQTAQGGGGGEYVLPERQLVCFLSSFPACSHCHPFSLAFQGVAAGHTPVTLITVWWSLLGLK